MTEIPHYNYIVEPEDTDYTLQATLVSLGSAILNTAGVDARAHGFGVDAVIAENRAWVLSRIGIELDSRPVQYSAYGVSTWISEYGRLMTTRNFTLADAEGREFGRAVSQWAMIDLTNRTIVDLTRPGEANTALIVDVPSPAEKPRRLHGITPAETVQHRVRYSDIDFNRHVNTMRYVELMVNMLPIEQITQHAAIRLDLHFIHECRYGQTLAIGYEQRDNTALFEICNDETPTAAVRGAIEWKII